MSFFQIQPENQGKLVWLSGPPGAGKSTTGALMGKEHGFVYFEADCSMNGLNPFVSVDCENPTLAAFRQAPLKASIFWNNSWSHLVSKNFYTIQKSWISVLHRNFCFDFLALYQEILGLVLEKLLLYNKKGLVIYKIFLIHRWKKNNNKFLIRMEIDNFCAV